MGTPCLLILFSVLLFSGAVSPLRHNHESQALIPRPLSSSQSPPALSWPKPQDNIVSSSASSIQLHLHHIDTLISLSANLSLSPKSLLRQRLRRDISRAASLSAMSNSSSPGFSSSVMSGLTQGSGEYFTRIGIGTPPRFLYMVLDTGSDVVWLQCSPCRKCYCQADPIFNPSRSSSFSPIPCASPLCHRLDSPGCNFRHQTCFYQVSYGDGSFTLGDLSTETLTFRRARVGPVALGCGHDNEGLFVGAAGLLGLGRGRLSFPSQAGPQFNNEFSYCLVDRSASSKPSSVIFGDLTALSRAVHFTPMLGNVSNWVGLKDNKGVRTLTGVKWSERIEKIKV